MSKEELINKINKLHSTYFGLLRIRKNLKLNVDNVVEYCKSLILKPDAKIERRGKNWYISVDGVIITVNAFTFTIITAHKVK